MQQVLDFGGHTRPEVAMVASVVRAGDTIIDVGAHVGTFAIPLARKAGPTGLVCAFEPTPWSYELLLLNIELNGLAGVIWPVPRAVSDKAAHFLAETPNQRNTGGSYLVDAADGLSSVTLDAWVEANLGDRRLDLIKIDVEGMEPLVLRGAQHLLDRDRPCVYVEVNPDNYSRYGVRISDLAAVVAGWKLFVNGGQRNAATDEFVLAEIEDISSVDTDHFDLLAVPPERMDRVSL